MREVLLHACSVRVQCAVLSMWVVYVSIETLVLNVPVYLTTCATCQFLL